MVKGIYAIKITLFVDQLKLTRREEKGIMKISLFVAMMHIKCYNEAPIAAHAQKYDRGVIQDIEDYGDRTVAAVADRAMRCHLWYRPDDMIGMALFDERERKREDRHRPGHEDTPRIMEQLTTSSGEKSQPAGATFHLGIGLIVKPHQKFLGEQTFFDEDVVNWSSNPLYQLAQK